MSTDVDITLTVNGERVARRVEARRHLIDFLRLDLGLMGSHTGCEHGVCGACTVRVDGQIVRGCLVLAASLDGAKVETIEGVSDTGEIRDLQDAFIARNACQCGYCTPGMLITAADLLEGQRRSRRARRSASTSPATTAAAPAITPSSMRSRRWPAARAQRGRPAIMNEIIDPRSVDRPNSYIGKSVPRPNAQEAGRGPRPVRRRHRCCRAWCTWPSCAARTRTRGSSGSTPARR